VDKRLFGQEKKITAEPLRTLLIVILTFLLFYMIQYFFQNPLLFFFLTHSTAAHLTLPYLASPLPLQLIVFSPLFLLSLVPSLYIWKNAET
jgi:hypothetical protein